MEFSLIAALVAGFVGTIAYTLTLRAGKRMGMTQMPSMNLIQGAMATDDPSTARRIGVVTHILVMGTVVFGIVYAALFNGFGTSSWLAGLLIGLVHGLVAGAIAMPMIGSIHPRMESVAAFSGTEVVSSDEDTLRVAKPGPFGLNYGDMTPVGLVAGHMVYGLVVALTYTALI